MNALANVHSLNPTQAFQRSLNTELQFLFDAVRGACPPSSIVNLCYDGRFNVHVDVQSYEDSIAVEALLPTVADGVLHDVRRTATPHQPFRRRVSATIAE
jgi:hypothetical protein